MTEIADGDKIWFPFPHLLWWILSGFWFNFYEYCLKDETYELFAWSWYDAKFGSWFFLKFLLCFSISTFGMILVRKDVKSLVFLSNSVTSLEFNVWVEVISELLLFSSSIWIEKGEVVTYVNLFWLGCFTTLSSRIFESFVFNLVSTNYFGFWKLLPVEFVFSCLIIWCFCYSFSIPFENVSYENKWNTLTTKVNTSR